MPMAGTTIYSREAVKAARESGILELVKKQPPESLAVAGSRNWDDDTPHGLAGPVAC